MVLQLRKKLALKKIILHLLLQLFLRFTFIFWWSSTYARLCNNIYPLLLHIKVINPLLDGKVSTNAHLSKKWHIINKKGTFSPVIHFSILVCSLISMKVVLDSHRISTFWRVSTCDRESNSLCLGEMHTPPIPFGFWMTQPFA